MEEITLQVQRDEQSGWLVASWDDPDGMSGITTHLRDSQQQTTEAVAVHFDEGDVPLESASISSGDPILVRA